jgi:hypothetical protein
MLVACRSDLPDGMHLAKGHRCAIAVTTDSQGRRSFCQEHSLTGIHQPDFKAMMIKYFKDLNPVNTG